MKIGVIQASSQIEKNNMLYECTKDYGEVINFGCFENEENYSYRLSGTGKSGLVSTEHFARW